MSEQTGGLKNTYISFSRESIPGEYMRSTLAQALAQHRQAHYARAKVKCAALCLAKSEKQVCYTGRDFCVTLVRQKRS
jgi:hypothetical protein